MRILVCGGRNFEDKNWLFRELDIFKSKNFIELLIQGGAEGADAYALSWAFSRNVPVVTMHANWYALGKSAGPIRNSQMLLLLKPDLVIAFPGRNGTADMIEQAYKAGVSVKEIS